MPVCAFSPMRSWIASSHGQRTVDDIRADKVHIMTDGRIVETGGPAVALALEAKASRSTRRPTPPDETPDEGKE